MADSSKWDEIELLVQRARGGDDEAFRGLLERHRSAVVSTLFACGVRCPETARDLAQDVALKAWRKLDGLKDPRTFPAWLRRIAANAARDHLRRAAVRREDELEDALHLEGGEDPHERTERVAEVRLMLAALLVEDDEIVRLLIACAERGAGGGPGREDGHQSRCSQDAGHAGAQAVAGAASPPISPGFVARAAKRKYPLGLSRIGRRSRSCATSRSTICDKHGGTPRFAVRSRHPVRCGL